MNKEQMLQHAIDENRRLQYSINVLSDGYGALVLGVGNFAGKQYKNKYRSATHIRNKSYPFIQYPPRHAVEQICIAFKQLGGDCSEYNFLDAGCGIGNIMLLANKVGFLVHGLEIDPTIIAFTEKLKILPGCIKRQNILTYKRYGEYDVIYFFRPIANKTKQAKFEKLLKEQMKIGAVLIPVFEADRGIIRDKRFKRIHVDQRSHIYQKIAK